MRYLLPVIILSALIPCVAVFGQSANKKIYITPFQVTSDGETRTQTMADEVRDYMSESLVSSYSLISDDEVKIYIGNAEMNQLAGGDNNFEKLAAAIKTDYLIYGAIRVGGTIEIEASLLGNGVIINTGSISYAKREYTDRAARALGKWLIMDRKSIGGLFGAKDPREEFKKDIEKLEENMNKIETDYLKGSQSIKGASQWRDKALASSPRVRLGVSGLNMFTAMDDYMNKIYDPFVLVMGDLFLYRYKDPVGDGIDLYLRGTYRKFEISKSQYARTSADYKDNIGDFQTLPDINGRLNIFSGDAGLRFVGSFYLLRSAISLYLSGAARFNYAVRDGNLFTKEKISFSQWGVIGGAGMEISIMPQVGLFAEFDIGYAPMGDDKINLEGPQAIVGVTFRTLHWE